ncbi:MAG: hypothetical protein ACFCD0_06805 [Gemmataceae bacterium]
MHITQSLDSKHLGVSFSATGDNFSRFDGKVFDINDTHSKSNAFFDVLLCLHICRRSMGGLQDHMITIQRIQKIDQLAIITLLDHLSAGVPKTNLYSSTCSIFDGIEHPVRSCRGQASIIRVHASEVRLLESRRRCGCLEFFVVRPPTGHVASAHFDHDNLRQLYHLEVVIRVAKRHEGILCILFSCVNFSNYCHCSLVIGK